MKIFAVLGLIFFGITTVNAKPILIGGRLVDQKAKVEVKKADKKRTQCVNFTGNYQGTCTSDPGQNIALEVVQNECFSFSIHYTVPIRGFEFRMFNSAQSSSISSTIFTNHDINLTELRNNDEVIYFSYNGIMKISETEASEYKQTSTWHKTKTGFEIKDESNAVVCTYEII